MTRVSGDWLTCGPTQRLFDEFEAGGYRLYPVGGCVRNALLDVPVSDIDMASDAPPDRMIALLERAEIKVVPTGVDHGTVTAILDDTAYEITTFRRDEETDGRHARVAFSTQLEEDACRRDFTINALYARRDGTVIDTVGGLADIDPPRVRFVGDARARIIEDYLRALRFFRFHAWYVPRGVGFDPETLAAIADTLDGLGTLSRERVGAELVKLLAAPDPAPECAIMARTGLLGTLVPGADPQFIGPLMHVEAALGLVSDPIRRLAALCSEEAAATLRLSRAQMRSFRTLRDWAQGTAGPGELGYRLGAELGAGALALRHAMLGTPPPATAMDDARFGSEAVFPVTARDLRETHRGKALGEKLRALEGQWIASGFRATKAELLG